MKYLFVTVGTTLTLLMEWLIRSPGPRVGATQTQPGERVFAVKQSGRRLYGIEHPIARGRDVIVPAGETGGLDSGLAVGRPEHRA